MVATAPEARGPPVEIVPSSVPSLILSRISIPASKVTVTTLFRPNLGIGTIQKV